ncbi:MAG TPA: NAD(P)-dependent oxidoreductase [Pseudonocardiaceae bacterium]|jgi:NADP-dependent aldehyde dehydrogenase|nr:NAD(P)-dependent oxidoreductase [Pseudonocardiaceae bacterium]
MTEQRILITGAAGGVGRLMRPRLRRPDRVLRLLDITAPAPAEPGERVEISTGSITDPAVIGRACADVDAIIHLGGLSREDTFENILAVNVAGTHRVLEAARAAGVSRVVLASSNHAAGFRLLTEAGTDGLPADSSPRPDTYYGFSKAAIEALGSLYQSRFGLDVICVRIGTLFEEPIDARALSTWLSPDDGARLFEACLSAPSPGFRIIWGVSDNTRRVASLAEAAALGYESKDNAEAYADRFPDGGPDWDYVGGGFTTTPLGQPNPM